MRILFVNTHFYMPQSFGGMAVTLHQLCEGLSARGHEVSVLAGFRRGGWFGLHRAAAMKVRGLLGGPKSCRDNANGYPVWRSWDPAGVLGDVASRERPDVVVIMGGQIVPAALAARRTRLPVVLQVHDVEMHWHGGDFADVADLPCIANSHFTAKAYQARFGVVANVIYPFIAADRYRVDQRGGYVTFVNPYRRKGVLIARDIARACPELPFLFVGEVHERDDDGDDIAASLQRLPNVTLVPPHQDMREIYRQTRVLLAPSQWQEAYGRVATEAQVSGIPVIGSDRGGLPEAIGDGGVILPYSTPIAEWATALREVWQDDRRYEDLSRKAAAWASRPAMDITLQLDAHERAISETLESHRFLNNTSA